MLLLRNKAATSFHDLRTINGRTYNTYKEACEVLGLLKDGNQWHSALQENAESGMPFQLRSMFVHILTNYPVADPLKLWTDNWKFLSDDILYNKRKKSDNVELKLFDADFENYTPTCIMHSYLSQDSIDTETGNDDNDYESSFPIEYLNFINMPSISNHDLKLKVGVVVMLMRNLNQIMVEKNMDDSEVPQSKVRAKVPVELDRASRSFMRLIYCVCVVDPKLLTRVWRAPQVGKTTTNSYSKDNQEDRRDEKIILRMPNEKVRRFRRWKKDFVKVAISWTKLTRKSKKFCEMEKDEGKVLRS
ncbi:hypothetical protein AgCh_021534 [Apium graveolens]